MSTYRKWTPDDKKRLVSAYQRGGIAAARAAFPGVHDSNLRSRLRDEGVRVLVNARTEELYARLTPLAPADDRPSAYDQPIVVRKGVGQWSAEIPRIRWVFDLAVGV